MNISMEGYVVNILMVSDDNFFSLGMKEIMTQDCNVFLIDVNSDFVLSELPVLMPWRVDFIFVSLASTVKFMQVMYKINRFMAKLVIFSDSRHINNTQATPHYRCVSKRLVKREVDEILAGVESVGHPGVSLTQREEAVLKLILQGLSNTKISIKMGISVKTVSAHKLNALRKFGLKKINQFGDFSMHYHHRFRSVIHGEH